MNISILFVDDEPRIIQSHQRSFRKKKEWDLFFAESGKEALEILSKNNIDAVVTDMRMPVMDGATLLKIITEKYPKIIRMILSGQSDQVEIMKAVPFTHYFFSKPINFKELNKKIEEIMEGSSYLKNQIIIDLINGLKNIPSVPEIYFEVQKELKKNNSSIKKIGSIITKDPAMSAGVLRCVNSSFFGLAKKEYDPVHAVILLGEEIVQGLILQISFFSALKDRVKNPNFSIQKLSDHCMKVAENARKMMTYEGHEKKMLDIVYTAGLLHDIGILILILLEDKYNQIYSNDDLVDIETFSEEYKVLGVSHAEIGAYLLNLWGIPSEIVQTVAFHHKPEEIPNKSYFDLVNAIHTADHIDNLILMQYSREVKK